MAMVISVHCKRAVSYTHLDLFAYYLTGVPGNEYCIASTSELLDARRRTWNMSLIRELGLPEHLFGELLAVSYTHLVVHTPRVDADAFHIGILGRSTAQPLFHLLEQGREVPVHMLSLIHI